MKYALILLSIILLSTDLNAQVAARTLYMSDTPTADLTVPLAGPASPDYAVLNQKGINSAERGEHREAASLFKRASELNPSCFVCKYNYARSLIRLGSYVAAVPILEDVVNRRPGFADAHASIGDAYSLLEDHEASLAHYRKALDLGPDDAVTLNNLANSLDRLGEYRDALAKLEKAISIRPDLFEAHCSRGVLLFRLGKRDEALKSLRAAESINASDASTLNNIGVVLDSTGKTEEAVGYYRRSMAADPEFAPALFNLGLVHVEQGQRGDAARILKALEPLDADLGTELRKRLSSKWVLRADSISSN